MRTIIMGYLLSYGYVLLCFVISWKLSVLFSWTKEAVRKSIHCLLAFIWIILCRNLAGTIHMVIIPATFVVLNYLSYRAGKYSSKTEAGKICLTGMMGRLMERDGEKETPGTVYYAVSLTLLSLIILIFKEPSLFPCTVGVFCLAFGDGIAGMAGKHSKGIWARHIVGDKTFGGTFCCMICSAAVCTVLLNIFGYSMPVLQIMTVGIGAGILELPGKGMDNITVPLGSAFFVYCLMI